MQLGDTLVVLGPDRAPLLDKATHSGDGFGERLDQGPDGWGVKVYPDAREAVLFQRPKARATPPGWEVDWALGAQDRLEGVTHATESDPAVLASLETAEKAAHGERCLDVASRRAKSRARRYCKSNRITRLVTLTYAVKQYDPASVTAHVNGLMRALRAGFGEAFPYLWVREHHKDGSLHVHVGLGRRVAVRCRRASCDPAGVGKGLSVDAIGGPCLRCSWGLGFVDARRLKRAPDGPPAASQGRRAEVLVATYLSKYVGKAFAEDAGEKGAKRYEVARGFQPACVVREGGPGTEWEVVAMMAEAFFGGLSPGFVWSSATVSDWTGPPVRVCFWD